MLVGACGSVPAPSLPPEDAGTDGGGWQKSCVTSAMVTNVESISPTYETGCIHGSWHLQSPNGKTVPFTSDQADFTAPVAPTPMALGDNPIDTTSRYAIKVSGSDQVNDLSPGGIGYSYAQLTAPFNTLSDREIGSVDASAFTGIEFDALITAPSGVRASIANAYTDPAGVPPGGKSCDPHPSLPNSCYDNPNVMLRASGAWTHYQVKFRDLTQNGFGNESPTGDQFPSNAIFHLRFDIDIPEKAVTPAWEIRVDNVKFFQ